jgi:4-hydroxy 2-oxovalerate aldolase
MIREEQKIQLLDCTLRDGGLGLEDSKNYYSKYPSFSEEQRLCISNKLAKSNIDIIELGSIEISKEDKTQFAIYQNIKDISKQIPQGGSNKRFAALYRGPDTPIDEIPKWNKTLCKKNRVIIRYSELQKSIVFCAALAKKGFEVIIQPMVTLRYKEEELIYMIEKANEMQAYALYFVDSYGYMTFDDINRLFALYNSKLNSNIRIGFHAHNNMDMAFANVQHFIELSKKTGRKIIIDSTCFGIGQGAGNLQTERIVPFLNADYRKKYDFNKILEICDILDVLKDDNLWGYSVYRFLPALYKTAYKYAVNMRLKYKLSFSTINQLLRVMPDCLRHRYTPDNLNILLEKAKNKRILITAKK